MALEKEIINDKIEIKGYEGLYAVTYDGRVWSYVSNKWLSLRPASSGYHAVILAKDGIRKTHLVHRLVAEAFCDNPNCKPQVNHIDGSKTNNHADNLEWVTASENHKHAWETGLHKTSEAHKQSARNAGHSRRMFSKDEIQYIRKMYKDFGFSQRKIAKFFETSQAVIQYITSGQTYSEVA
jgi:hypothetical protein